MTDRRTITRREAMKSAAGLGLLNCLPELRAETAPRTGLGLVVYCVRIRRDRLLGRGPGVDLFRPTTFLEHAIRLGAGGVQMSLGGLTATELRALREQAEDADRFIEAIVRLPGDRDDLGRFESEVRTANEAGALAARTTMISGRRYEVFGSLEEFREAEAKGRRSVELAAPICEEYRLPLAIENHKDHRDDERVALLEHIGSEYVGACVDTGNSVALLEDPIGTVRALAPWAHSVHLKDQAFRPYRDGFLLGDIPLGRGGLDLKSMIDILRTAKPKVRFNLELITRDPLEIPCLTERYWATLPDVPGRDLAATLRLVRDHPGDELQYVSKMAPAEQLVREDANVNESLEYAGQALKI